MYKKIGILSLYILHYSLYADINTYIKNDTIVYIDPLDEDLQEYDFDIENLIPDTSSSNTIRIENQSYLPDENMLTYIKDYFYYCLYCCYIQYIIMKESACTNGEYWYNRIQTIVHNKLKKI